MQMQGVDLGTGARPSRTDADVNKSNTRDVLT